MEAAGQLFLNFHSGLDYSFTCINAGEGVLWNDATWRQSTLVLHDLLVLGAYESLDGLLVSHSPYGVSLARPRYCRAVAFTV